jgi:hypothetical protein
MEPCSLKQDESIEVRLFVHPKKVYGTNMEGNKAGIDGLFQKIERILSSEEITVMIVSVLECMHINCKHISKNPYYIEYELVLMKL